MDLMSNDLVVAMFGTPPTKHTGDSIPLHSNDDHHSYLTLWFSIGKVAPQFGPFGSKFFLGPFYETKRKVGYVSTRKEASKLRNKAWLQSIDQEILQYVPLKGHLAESRCLCDIFSCTSRKAPPEKAEPTRKEGMWTMVSCEYSRSS
jgi:hypothetical protein